MATRKKPSDTGMLFAVPEPPKKPEYDASRLNVPTRLITADELPSGTPVIGERRFSVVKSPKVLKEDVIVEMVDEDVFEVSLLRHHGTTIAAVRYSRPQLEQLVARARAALGAG